MTPGLDSSIRRAFPSKRKGSGIKFQRGTVGGPVTIMLGS